MTFPPHLTKAAELFFHELQGHVAFFQSALNENSKSVDWQEVTKRCHLIKGGAGFLQLVALRDAASAAEKLGLAGPNSVGDKGSEEFIQALKKLLDLSSSLLQSEK